MTVHSHAAGNGLRGQQPGCWAPTLTDAQNSQTRDPALGSCARGWLLAPLGQCLQGRGHVPPNSRSLTPSLKFPLSSNWVHPVPVSKCPDLAPGALGAPLRCPCTCPCRPQSQPNGSVHSCGGRALTALQTIPESWEAGEEGLEDTLNKTDPPRNLA